MIIRNVPEALRRAIKILAAERGVTMGDLVIEVMEKAVKK